VPRNRRLGKKARRLLEWLWSVFGVASCLLVFIFARCANKVRWTLGRQRSADGHAPDPIFARVRENQTQKVVKHPIRSLARPLHLRTGVADDFERRKSRSSDFGVILRPRLSVLIRDSGICGAFVVRYSGATVRDLHSVPYSPMTVATGTLSHINPQYIVGFSKNHTGCRFFRLICQAVNSKMSASLTPNFQNLRLSENFVDRTPSRADFIVTGAGSIAGRFVPLCQLLLLTIEGSSA
jgi:hypothetical protein